MQTDKLSFVDEVFNHIITNITAKHRNVVNHLQDIKPKGLHDSESIEWRM